MSEFRSGRHSELAASLLSFLYKPPIIEPSRMVLSLSHLRACTYTRPRQHRPTSPTNQLDALSADLILALLFSLSRYLSIHSPSLVYLAVPVHRLLCFRKPTKSPHMQPSRSNPLRCLRRHREREARV